MSSLCNEIQLLLADYQMTIWLGVVMFFHIFQCIGKIGIAHIDVNPAFSCHAQVHESRGCLSLSLLLLYPSSQHNAWYIIISIVFESKNG